MNRLPTFLVLGLLLMCGACAALKPQEPEITLHSVRALNLSLSGQRLAISLNVSNPNSFDLNLRGVDLTATLGGEAIASGGSDQSVTIPAGGEQTVELFITAGFDVVFSGLRSMLRNNQSGLDYAVTGSVRIARWPAPIPFVSDGRMDNPIATPDN